MARCPSLPFLPGFTFNPLIGQTDFKKKPHFDFIGAGGGDKGVRALSEKVTPNILGPLSDKYPSLYARGEAPEIPTWIAYDKQILCFDAFFQETLHEFNGASFIVRKVKILFYLEDGTIKIMEPRVDNSGISQGMVISRQRIRLPPPMDFNFYDIMDFNVGNEVEFFRRIYKITNCDQFTRVFLNRCGIAVPDPITPPTDPYLERRSHDIEDRLPKKPNRKEENPLGKFLANDRKVLRFYAYWDDQKTMYGYLHHLEVKYYLADDTIEIKENVFDSAGHNNGFMFVRRSKVPKVYKGLPGPGTFSPFTVLNVLTSSTGSYRYIADSLNCGKEHIEYYREQDLLIGGIMNIFGREIILTDCDPYTKEYYRKKYGVSDFTPVETPVDLQEPIVEEPTERELPPWNGYGTFEDSAQNCITVEPKAPERDFKKFLKFDKIGLDSHVLRFEGRMISRIPENCGRIFVISYFLADETISVFELAKQNSGFMKSVFFKRSEIKLPGQLTFTSKPPEMYQPQQMFIGATININSYEFVLVDADDYCLRYMEINAQNYPKANITVIMDKVREALRPVYKDFIAENMPKEVPAIPYYVLRDKLCRIMGKDFTEHEMVTISRAFSANCVEEKYDREAIRAITLTELKRNLWDNLERINEYFLKMDFQRSGVLSRADVYTLLKACRLPVDRVLLDRILGIIKKDEQGKLYYADIINFLDRSKCPLADTIPINIKYDLWWGSIREPVAGKLINWCEFNKMLNLESTFADAIGDGQAHH